MTGVTAAGLFVMQISPARVAWAKAARPAIATASAGLRRTARNAKLKGFTGVAPERVDDSWSPVGSPPYQRRVARGTAVACQAPIRSAMHPEKGAPRTRAADVRVRAFVHREA